MIGCRKFTNTDYTIYDDEEKLGCMDTIDNAKNIVALLNKQERVICRLNSYLTNALPFWVFENIISRRIEAADDENVKKELKELLEELR